MSNITISNTYDIENGNLLNRKIIFNNTITLMEEQYDEQENLVHAYHFIKGDIINKINNIEG